MNAGSWCKLFQTGRNHIFLVCMCLFVLSGGAVLGLGTQLSLAPDSTGIYVGSVGYWKILSTFRRCVLPYKSICINCMLCIDLYRTYEVCIYCIFVSSLNDFLFCPCLICLLSVYNLIMNLSICLFGYVPVRQFDLSMSHI